MTDPIADMLNRIHNAQVAAKPSVLIPWSNFKYELAVVLEKQGFVGKIEKLGKKTQKQIKIDLIYKEKKPIIEKIQRISKPGQRIYASAREIKRIRGGYGMSVISTPNGLMTDSEARRQKIGGEIICEIW